MMNAVIPSELSSWNWGALLLNWIWGLGNNTFIALLVFVPCIGVFMPFVLAVKGNEWAWRNKKWDSVEHFQSVQKKWALAGAAVFAALILFLAVFALVLLPAVMKSSGAYKIALKEVRANPAAVEYLGEPIEPGWFVLGNISTTGSRGKADISFSVKGTSASGRVHVDAVKSMGRWKMNGLLLRGKKDAREIDLLE